MTTIARGSLSMITSNTTKLVRKANGNLVTGVIVSGSLQIFENAKNTTTWTHIKNIGGGVQDFALETIGNKIIVLYNSTSVTQCLVFGDSWAQESSTSVHQRTSQVGAASIRANREGTELHVACRGYMPEHSTTKPPIIFYVKGAIASNGEVTWASEVQITTQTGSYTVDTYISSIMVDDNGKPYIVFSSDSNNYDYTYVVSPSLPVSEVFPINSASGWGNKLITTHGAQAQVQLYSLYTSGEFNVVWTELNSTTGVYTLNRAKSLDKGATWTTEKITNSSNGTASFTIDSNGHMYILHGSPLQLTTNKNGTWVSSVVAYGTVGSPSVVYDRSLSATVDTIPPVVYMNHTTSGSSVEAIGNYTANNAPTITITSPAANQTLHENSTFTLSGNTTDTDVDNVVTVKYQIDSGAVRNLSSGVSDGTTPINFNKALTYKDGTLHDGATAITSVLDKDTPHTVSMWAEDGNGGKSSIITRAFFVVPNRPPSLTINPIATQSDLINSNVINVSGAVTDADNNNVTVKFAINGGEEQQVYAGPPSAFTFNIMLNNLKIGANTVIVKATDSYNTSGTKTLTINKTHNATAVNTAVARYQVIAPTGSAKSILLWIQRTIGNLGITAEVSMTNASEAENYQELNFTNSGIANNLREDEYAHQGAVEKDKIILKITYDRTDASMVDTIKQISGVLF